MPALSSPSLEKSWFASRATDGIAGLFGLWMVVGLFADGWAHRNAKPESFFSPWHGILYSGFAASAVWMLRVVRDGQRRGLRGLGALPVGYLVRAVGVALFGAAGVGDFIWHSAFGIEANVEALLSPPHLVLLTGGILMACGPIVSTLARIGAPTGERTTWSSTGSAVAAVTFITSVLGFFLMYASPYDHGLYDRDTFENSGGPLHGGWLGRSVAYLAVASILLFAVLTAMALIWLTRNVDLPAGALTVVFGVPAIAQTALTSFHTLPRAAGPIVAGLVGDVTWKFVARRSPLIMAGWVAGLTTLCWFVFFGAVAAREGIGWSAELWAGSSVLAGLLCGLAAVASSPFKRQGTA